jgi:DNA-binding transcriptional LysR family regulator
MEHLDLDALVHFIAVARHGGVNAAARETGIPKATLSRRIRELEARFGTPLLERGGAKLKLTEDGRLLLDRAAPLLADLDALCAEMSARSGLVRGRLRVSIPTPVAVFGMGGFAARFARTYPAVELEMDIDDRFVDPVSEGYDVVVRVNPLPESDLVGRRFLRTQSVLASLPSMPLPRHTGERVDAVVLSATGSQSAWTVLCSEGELTVIPRQILRCSSMMLVYEAVLAGAGAALLPASLIQEDLAKGRLKAWGTVPNRDIEVWVLHAPAHLTSPRIRAFVDLLVDEFQKSETS